MDLNEIFKRPNVILVDYPTFVFSVKDNDVIRNPEDETKGQTIQYNCDVEGFKTVEDIVTMLDGCNLVVVVKNSLRPSPVPEYDFLLRYKKIK